MSFNETMRDVLSNIDDLDAELVDISRLLSVYDEIVSEDMGPLLKGESWGDIHLVGRWPLHQSTLSVIQLRLYDILSNLQSNIQKGYDAFKTNTPAQA